MIDRAKRKDIDFLIFYEVKTREIDNVALLRNELVSRGHTVEVLCFAEAVYPKRFTRFRNRVRIAIMPSLYHTEEIIQHVLFAAGKVDNIVNIQWEQIWSIESETNTTAYNYPKGEAKKAFHFCWGEGEAENMRRASIEKDKLIVVGPPQMDFFRPEFRNKLLCRDALLPQYGIPTDMKTILFVSSYVFKRTIDLSCTDKLSIKETSYIVTLQWIRRLLEEHGDEISFIYRPHPVEIDNPLIKELEKEYSNFFIVPNRTIKEWITCCDRVCTWVSTSISDMHFAGVPCAILRPAQLSDDQEMASYRNAALTTSYEQFESFVLHGTRMPLDPRILARYYDVQENRSSTSRMCDELIQIANSGIYFDWDLSIIEEFDKTFKKRYLKKWVRGITYRLLNKMFPILKKVDPKMKSQLTRFIYSIAPQWIANIAPEAELEMIYEHWSLA